MIHPHTKTLLDFIEGRLSPEKTSEVNEHLSDCRQCRKETQRLKTISSALTPGEDDPKNIFLFPEKANRLRSHLISCDFCYHLLESFAEEQLEGPPQQLASKFTRYLFPNSFRPLSFRWGLSSAMLTLALAALVLWQISSPIPYDYNITAQRRNNVRSNNTFMLQPQELLYSGDKFQIEITPAKDLLFYAFLYSSSGSAQILFPSPDVSMDNHLKTRALITQFHQQGFGPWMNRPARKQSFSFLLANHLKSSTVFLWN